jgi:hypothetical protein
MPSPIDVAPPGASPFTADNTSARWVFVDRNGLSGWPGDAFSLKLTMPAPLSSRMSSMHRAAASCSSCMRVPPVPACAAMLPDLSRTNTTPVVGRATVFPVSVMLKISLVSTHWI